MKTTMILGVLLALTAGAVEAEAVTLRAVTSFAERTQLSRYFEKSTDTVAVDTRGQVKINYIGGPTKLP